MFNFDKKKQKKRESHFHDEFYRKFYPINRTVGTVGAINENIKTNNKTIGLFVDGLIIRLFRVENTVDIIEKYFLWKVDTFDYLIGTKYDLKKNVQFLHRTNKDLKNPKIFLF